MSAVLDAPVMLVKPPVLQPSDSLYEVVDGQRVEEPGMSMYSHFIAVRLLVALSAYLGGSRRGVAVHETLLVLDVERDLRRRPDVAYVSFERWPAEREIPETGDWDVIPDLAVEVVSPNDIFKDVLHKVHEYLRYGVKEVWVVSPDERVLYRYRSPQDVQVVTHEQEIVGDPLLPGFCVKLADLLDRRLAVSAVTPA